MLKRQAITNPDSIFGKCPTSVDLAAVFHKEKPRKRRYSQVCCPCRRAFAARPRLTRCAQRTSSGLWEADRLLQEEEEEYLDVSARMQAADVATLPFIASDSG